MIQLRSIIKPADNCGAKSAQVIHVYTGSRHKKGTVCDGLGFADQDSVADFGIKIIFGVDIFVLFNYFFIKRVAEFIGQRNDNGVGHFIRCDDTGKCFPFCVSHLIFVFL